MAVVKLDENSSLLDSFLDRLSNDTSELRLYSHMNDALTSVERGENIAVIRIGQNSSTDSHYRLSWRAAAANNDDSQEEFTLNIDIVTDDQEMRYFFQKIVIDFVKVLRRGSPEAGDVSWYQMTLRVADPVYGSRLINNFEYFLPPFLLITIFVVTMAETIFTWGVHVVNGVIHFPFAFLGVKCRDFLISCCLRLLCILLVHVALVLSLLPFSIRYDLIPIEGSITLVIALIFMEALCGIAAGLLGYSIYNFVYQNLEVKWFWYAVYAAPFCYLIAWIPSPLHRLKIFRSIGDFLLHTVPTSSLRQILYNGCNLEDDDVLDGFTTLTKFMGVFLIVPVIRGLYILWGEHYIRVILTVIYEAVKERARPTDTEV